MDWADTVNALFELFASVAIFDHCRVLLRDKKVHGVSLLATIFFTAWGFWNIYYYPSLGQNLSFYCGILVVMANIAWVSLIIKYKK